MLLYIKYNLITILFILIQYCCNLSLLHILISLFNAQYYSIVNRVMYNYVNNGINKW